MSFHRHQDAAVAASLDVVSVPRIRGAFVQVSGLPTTVQAKHPGRGAFVKQDGASDLPRDHLASFRMHCGAIRSKGSAPRREPRSGNRHTRAVVAAMAGRTAVQFAAFHWPGPPSCRRTVPRSAPGPQRAAAGCDGRVRAEGAGSTLAGYQVGLPGRGAWTPRNPCGRGGWRCFAHVSMRDGSAGAVRLRGRRGPAQGHGAASAAGRRPVGAVIHAGHCHGSGQEAPLIAQRMAFRT